MNERGWSLQEETIVPLDQYLSQILTQNHIRHYAIKYNPFMAVKVTPDVSQKDPSALS